MESPFWLEAEAPPMFRSAGPHHVHGNCNNAAMLYDHRDEHWGPVTRPRMGRHPYIRITLPDGTVVDGNATAWTKDKVYALWLVDLERHLQWMDTEHVIGIERDESSWTDAYDDYSYFYPAAPADGWD
jgi:hypothetical protein